MHQLNATAVPPLNCGVEASRSIDRSVLDAIRALQSEEDPNIVRELIIIYLEDSGARLSDMRNAVSMGDPALIRRAAHGLRGSSANLGANTLAALCAQLEDYPGAAAASELLELIELEFSNVRAALELESRS